jgi:hypothetical protein
MGGLGLIFLWGGYTLFVFGYARTKSARGGVGLSIADCALPSHRAAYESAMASYSGGGAGGVAGTGVAGAGGQGASTAGPGAAPGSVISTGTLGGPSGTPAGGGPTQIFPGSGNPQGSAYPET